MPSNRTASSTVSVGKNVLPNSVNWRFVMSSKIAGACFTRTKGRIVKSAISAQARMRRAFKKSARGHAWPQPAAGTVGVESREDSIGRARKNVALTHGGWNCSGFWNCI